MSSVCHQEDEKMGHVAHVPNLRSTCDKVHVHTNMPVIARLHDRAFFLGHAVACSGKNAWYKLPPKTWNRIYLANHANLFVACHVDMQKYITHNLSLCLSLCLSLSPSLSLFLSLSLSLSRGHALRAQRTHQVQCGAAPQQHGFLAKILATQRSDIY